MLNENQIKKRKSYIGGTDAAAICGLSRWKTQLETWAEKTGKIKPKDLSGNLAVTLGTRLEETVAELFMEATGKKVRRCNKTLFHKEYDFIGANIDRDVVGEDAILECKTCSAWKAKEWLGEDIPSEYILQVVHYLAVTGAKYGYIAVLIGNSEFKWQMITRDDDLIRDLIKKEVYFWREFIEKDVMPMSIQAGDSDVLYSLFSVADSNKDLMLDDKANAIIERLEASTAEYRALEGDIEKYKNELKAMLGEGESGQTDKYRLTWKLQHTNRIDTERFKKENEELYKAYLKTTSTRVLRYSVKDKK